MLPRCKDVTMCFVVDASHFLDMMLEHTSARTFLLSAVSQKSLFVHFHLDGNVAIVSHLHAISTADVAPSTGTSSYNACISKTA